jgi:hypothetical protein
LDLVEEIGRTRPRTVSELMETTNRFADGEDVYNNKRGVLQKLTKQVGKGEDTAMATTTEGEIR